MRKKIELQQNIARNKEICSAMRKKTLQWKKIFRYEKKSPAIEKILPQ
jgi:hypothetical protein